MAKKKQPAVPTIAEEAGLDASWSPVETAPIIPSNPAGAPWVPNAGSQFYAGPLPSAMQHDATFVQTQYQGPRIPSYPLVPPGASGQPNVNSAVKSVTAPQFEDIQTQIDTITSSGVGVEQIIDTTGTFVITEKNGTAKLNTPLPYIQSPLNDNFATDTALSSQWTLIGAGPNFSYSFSGNRLTLKGNNSTVDQLYGIMQPISDPTPWTYVANVTFQTGYGDVPLANGIAVGNSSGEYVTWGFSEITQLDLIRWNSASSVNGSYGVQPNQQCNQLWLALQNDGTNLNAQISFDGVNYMTWVSVTLASFIGTISTIGCLIDARTICATSYTCFRKIQ